MLAVAKEHLNKTKMIDRVILHVADAMDIQHFEEKFDAIFTSFTLDLIDTPEIPIVLAGCQKA